MKRKNISPSKPFSFEWFWMHIENSWINGLLDYFCTECVKKVDFLLKKKFRRENTKIKKCEKREIVKFKNTEIILKCKVEI